MIIHPKPFKRIIKIKEKYDSESKPYNFILLYFDKHNEFYNFQTERYYKQKFGELIKYGLMKEPNYNQKIISAEVIFFNGQECNLRYLMQYFPLMVIYDKDRFEKISKYSYNLKPIVDSILNRKLSETNANEITDNIFTMSYKYIVENKDLITQKISNLFHLDKILKDFKELDKYFLKEKNHITLKERTDLSIEDFMKPVLIKKKFKDKEDTVQKEDNRQFKSNKSEEFENIINSFHNSDEETLDYSNYNHIRGIQKKNINAILKKHKSLELKNFFYHNNIKDIKGKSEKEDLKVEYNKFYKNDREEMLSVLEYKNNTSQNIYKEILNEIDYCNLYQWDYTLGEHRFEDIFMTLFSKIGENQITSISTKYSNEDYFRRLIDGDEFNFDTKIEEELKKEFGNIEEDSIREELEEECKGDFEELQMVESYLQDRLYEIEKRREELEEEYMEESSESMDEEYLNEFYYSLGLSDGKHSKYKKIENLSYKK